MTPLEAYIRGLEDAEKMCDRLIATSPKSHGVGYWHVLQSMICHRAKAVQADPSLLGVEPWQRRLAQKKEQR
jgi:hypothetical protein